MPAAPVPATFSSACSGREFPFSERVSGATVRPALLALMQRQHPGFGPTDALAVSELNQFRRQYMQDYLLHEAGGLTELEQTVLDHLQSHSTLTDKLEDDAASLTLGQRLADRVASFGAAGGLFSASGAGC
jgi:hypothetical protein